MANEPTSSNDSATLARSGRCAIVGRPNVGKSTLLNALLDQKLAIATPRPGTTRSNVLGVYTSDDPPTQIAFVDTPGMERPRDALGRVLADTAAAGLAECDAALLVVEATLGRAKSREVDPRDVRILSMLEQLHRPVLLAVNKIDLVKDKSRLLPLLEAYGKAFPFQAIIPVSARKSAHLGSLVAELRSVLSEGLMFDPDLFTDRSERFFVAELVREAAMRLTRQEVPQGLACMIESFDETGPTVKVHATIVVNRDSHKGIVIGAHAATIKEIGIAAREEIERMLERKVMLKLWVKVVPGWTRDPSKARQYAHEVEWS